jgi:hypothetical protein
MAGPPADSAERHRHDEVIAAKPRRALHRNGGSIHRDLGLVFSWLAIRYVPTDHAPD